MIISFCSTSKLRWLKASFFHEVNQMGIISKAGCGHTLNTTCRAIELLRPITGSLAVSINTPLGRFITVTRPFWSTRASAEPVSDQIIPSVDAPSFTRARNWVEAFRSICTTPERGMPSAFAMVMPVIVTAKRAVSVLLPVTGKIYVAHALAILMSFTVPSQTATDDSAASL